MSNRAIAIALGIALGTGATSATQQAQFGTGLPGGTTRPGPGSDSHG